MTTRDKKVGERNAIQLTLRDRLAKQVSVSGLGYTIGTAVTFRRRSTWGLIVLSALVWMVILIFGRVQHLLSFPTAVDIEIKTEQELTFPAVTICNQNMLSATKVFNSDEQKVSPTLVEALKYYIQSETEIQHANTTSSYKKTVEEMESRYGHLLDKFDVATLFENLTMEKKKFIYKCSWMGQEGACSSDDFETVITDSGLCYTFNGNTSSSRNSSKAGSRGGLSLTLFIEQHDYFLHGTNEVAGAMVRVHDQSEIPAFISESGVSLPVGFGSKLGFRQTKMKYLEPPYGVCGETELTEFPAGTPYSTINCELNLLTYHVKSKCGCVDSYMPRLPETRYCTLTERAKCLLYEQEVFRKQRKLESHYCPPPCSSTNVIQTVSYAKNADHFFRNLALIHRHMSTVNYIEALNIQKWILLNALNASFTDEVANISQNIKTLYEDNIMEMRRDFDDLISFLEIISNTSERDVANLAIRLLSSLRPGTTLKLVVSFFDRAFPCFTYSPEVLCLPSLDPMVASVVSEKIITYGYVAMFNGVPVFEQITADRKLWHREIMENERRIDQIDSEMKLHPSEVLSSVKQRLFEFGSSMASVVTYTNELRDMVLNLTTTLEQYRLWTLEDTTAVTEVHSPSYFQKNYLEVDIYFHDMTVQYVSQERAYSVIALFSDIGGSIGLCLGGSILTIVEIVDVIMTWCAGRKKGKTEERYTQEPCESTSDGHTQSVHI